MGIKETCISENDLRCGSRKNKLLIAIGLLSLAFESQIVLAAPQSDQIVGGSGNITQSGLTTSIQQNTKSLAINWNSFDVSKNETVNFLQPNTSAIALNRILGGSASQIFGQINANGQVVQ